MKHQADNYRDLPEFLESLKGDIRQWLAESKTKQQDLASLLGFHPGYVSASLRAGSPMAEQFVDRLSRTVPQFSNAIIVYFELKTGVRASAETQKAMDRARDTAQLEIDVLAAAKEVEEAVAKFTAVVRSYVKNG